MKIFTKKKMKRRMRRGWGKKRVGWGRLQGWRVVWGLKVPHWLRNELVVYLYGLEKSFPHVTFGFKLDPGAISFYWIWNKYIYYIKNMNDLRYIGCGTNLYTILKTWNILDILFDFYPSLISQYTKSSLLFLQNLL